MSVTTLGNVLSYSWVPMYDARWKVDTKSSTVASTRHYPEELRPMDDINLEQETLNFLGDQTELLNRATQFSMPLVANPADSEGSVYSELRQLLHLPIGEIENPPFCVGERSTVEVVGFGNFYSSTPSVRTADAVCEVKPPWILEGMPKDKEALCNMYRTAVSPNSWWRAISQVCGYMIDDNIGYGILTTFNTTWFLIARGNSFYISDGYRCDRESSTTQASVAQLMYYFYWKAKHASNNVQLTHPYSYRYSGQHFPTINDDSGESHFDRSSDSSSDTSSAGSGERSSKRFKKESDSLSSLQYPYYTFQMLSFESYLGRGERATVVKGNINGTPVAVKLYDMSKGGGPLLDHELSVYDQLKDYQGKYIPNILALASSGGNMEGYCMSYANPITTWTPDMKNKAKHVLTQLVILAGLVQRDIHGGNFAVADNGNVWVLDMERTLIETTRKAKERYIKVTSRMIDGW